MNEGQAANPQADNMRYNLGQGQQSAARNITPPKPPNPSCFGNIEDVVGSSESAAARVERVVNRLVGHEPEDPRADGLKSGPGALFSAADEHAREIRRNLQRILHAVDRLESQLP